jgi:glycosyltransferase involved in cell wall biosynthesis
MRPLIFIMTSLAPTGGIERDAIKCFKALAAQGRKLHVAVAFLHPDVPAMFEGADITWHRLKTIKRPPVLGQWWLWRQAEKLERELKVQHPDALSVAFEWMPVGDIQIGAMPPRIWWQARKQMGLPTWNRPTLRLWGNFVERHTIRRGARLAVYSEMAKEAFMANGMPGDHIERVIIPTDLDTFRPQPADLDARREVLLIGSDPKRKGVDLVLKAWPAIHAKHPELTLNIVCKGWKVPRLVEQLQLPGVITSPLITDPETYYNRARVVLAPSLFETWGNIVPEALAAGVPVITSSQTPASELVDRPAFGHVLERSADTTRDKEALVRSTLELLSLTESPASMQERHRHVLRFQQTHTDLVSWIVQL